MNIRTHSIPVIPAILAGLFAFISISTRAQVPTANLLLHYDFNAGSGTTITDLSTSGRDGKFVGSGGKFGVDGSGLSGVAGDYAFDNTASTMAGAGAAVQYDAGSGNSSMGTLTSFTVTMWLTPDSAVVDLARLFDAVNAPLFRVTDTGGLRLQSGDTLFDSASLGFTPNQWTFVGLTFDAGTITVYSGGTTPESLSVVLPSETSPTPSITSIAFGRSINFGGTSNGARAFDGSLDNIRVYGTTSGGDGALDIDGIRAIHAADLGIVPEPSTYALFGGILVMLLAIWHRRLSRT
ncbi:PEP-CTERM putative exosortase interaction domain-containing protein [Opitutaceae bacterium TAV1]|nr:PEP-CTERM putative exosortase interaction domain-containing protein [Opitutaceae bacterium TAV1]